MKLFKTITLILLTFLFTGCYSITHQTTYEKGVSYYNKAESEYYSTESLKEGEVLHSKEYKKRMERIDKEERLSREKRLQTLEERKKYYQKRIEERERERERYLSKQPKEEEMYVFDKNERYF